MPILSTTATVGEKRKKKKKKKRSKRIYRVSQTIRIINVFLESLLSESFSSLGVTAHLISLGCPPTLYCSLDPDVESAQILIWSYSYVFLPPMSSYLVLQLSEIACFLLWEP